MCLSNGHMVRGVAVFNSTSNIIYTRGRYDFAVASLRPSPTHPPSSTSHSHVASSQAENANGWGREIPEQERVSVIRRFSQHYIYYAYMFSLKTRENQSKYGFTRSARTPCPFRACRSAEVLAQDWESSDCFILGESVAAAAAGFVALRAPTGGDDELRNSCASARKASAIPFSFPASGYAGCISSR